jgi:hypothetical protein
MKITKERLTRIIKEEISNVLKEDDRLSIARSVLKYDYKVPAEEIDARLETLRQDHPDDYEDLLNALEPSLASGEITKTAEKVLGLSLGPIDPAIIQKQKERDAAIQRGFDKDYFGVRDRAAAYAARTGGLDPYSSDHGK